MWCGGGGKTAVGLSGLVMLALGIGGVLVLGGDGDGDGEEGFGVVSGCEKEKYLCVYFIFIAFTALNRPNGLE